MNMPSLRVGSCLPKFDLRLTDSWRSSHPHSVDVFGDLGTLPLTTSWLAQAFNLKLEALNYTAQVLNISRLRRLGSRDIDLNGPTLVDAV